MLKPLNVAILAFPGCQVLDVSGPAMVFEAGNGASGKSHYNVHILSPKGGTIQTNSAVALVTKPLRTLPPRAIDTLLIAGGDASGLRMLVADRSVRKWARPGKHEGTPLRLRLHGHIRPGALRSAARQAGRHSLVSLLGTGGTLPRGPCGR